MIAWEGKTESKELKLADVVDVPTHNRAWEMAKRTAEPGESLSTTMARAEAIRKQLEAQ